ncbi:lysophospholipase [Cerioporus squamosus]|nr:lysophospholipase [Cerioporus squamosus]
MTAAPYTEAWLDGIDGHSFYTRTYAAAAASSNPKAILVFVHGFADHISRYERIHPQFAQRGITVFAYDMRGFGLTALDVEHRSPDEAYGKTSRAVELSDLEWWVRYVRRTYPGMPIFVMGHSAGAGMTLAFATRTSAPPSKEALGMISGIIAQIVRFAAYVLSRVAPALSFPANMPEERFSHDKAEVEALANDPLRKPQGTALGLYDMVTQGEELLEKDYKNWPSDLSLLMTWGTADEANSPKAGVAFFNKVNIDDKKLVEYEVHIPTQVIKEYVSWIEAHLQARVPKPEEPVQS